MDRKQTECQVGSGKLNQERIAQCLKIKPISPYIKSEKFFCDSFCNFYWLITLYFRVKR